MMRVSLPVLRRKAVELKCSSAMSDECVSCGILWVQQNPPPRVIPLVPVSAPCVARYSVCLCLWPFFNAWLGHAVGMA